MGAPLGWILPNSGWELGLWPSYILLVFVLSIKKSLCVIRDACSASLFPESWPVRSCPETGDVQVEERGTNVLVPHQLLAPLNISRTWLAPSSSLVRGPGACQAATACSSGRAGSWVPSKAPVRLLSNSGLSSVLCKLPSNMQSCAEGRELSSRWEAPPSAGYLAAVSYQK